MHLALHCFGLVFFVWNAIATAQSVLQKLVELNEVNPQFNILLGNIQKFPALTTFLNESNSATLFAPTDNAFLNRGFIEDEILEATLNYHMSESEIAATSVSFSVPLVAFSRLKSTIETSKLLLNLPDGVSQVLILNKNQENTVKITHGFSKEATILSSFQASNGPIHVIDTVMIIPPNFADSMVSSENISFLSLLNSVSVSKELLQLQELTLFIPTIAAFGQSVLSHGMTAEAALNVIKYHASDKINYSDKFENNKKLPTLLDGAELTITTTADSNAYVNGIEIVKANILFNNGVGYLINGVLSYDGNVDDTEVVYTAPSAEFEVIEPTSNDFLTADETSTSVIIQLGEAPTTSSTDQATTVTTYFAPSSSLPAVTSANSEPLIEPTFTQASNAPSATTVIYADSAISKDAKQSTTESKSLPTLTQGSLKDIKDEMDSASNRIAAGSFGNSFLLAILGILSVWIFASYY